MRIAHALLAAVIALGTASAGPSKVDEQLDVWTEALGGTDEQALEAAQELISGEKLGHMASRELSERAQNDDRRYMNTFLGLGACLSAERSAKLRATAAHAIRKVGAWASSSDAWKLEVRPALELSLDADDTAVRGAAALALLYLESSKIVPKRTNPALELLKSGSPALREEATAVIGVCVRGFGGRHARDSRPPNRGRRGRGNEVESAEQQAAKANEQAAKVDLILGLVGALADPEEAVRKRARSWLKQSAGAVSRVPTPRLVEGLTDALGGGKLDAGGRVVVIQCCGRLQGNATVKVVEALAAALSDASPDVQAAAVIALGDLGPAADTAIPAMQEAAKSADAYFRLQLKKALMKIQGEK